MRPEVLDPSKQGLPDYMGKQLLAFVMGLSTLEGLEGLVGREVLEGLESLEGHGGREPLVMVAGTVVAVGGVGSLLLQGDEGTAEGDIDDAVGVHKDADQEVPRVVVPHRVAWQPGGDNSLDRVLGDPGVPTEAGNLDDHPGEVHSLLDRVAEDADYLLEVRNSKWVCQRPENLAEDQLQVQAAKVFEQLEGSHMEDKAHWLAAAAHFH